MLLYVKNVELKSLFKALRFNPKEFAVSINETSSITSLFCTAKWPPLKFQLVPLYFNDAIFEISSPALVFDKSDIFTKFEAKLIRRSHISTIDDEKLVVAPFTIKSPLIFSVPL